MMPHWPWTAAASAAIAHSSSDAGDDDATTEGDWCCASEDRLWRTPMEMRELDEQLTMMEQSAAARLAELELATVLTIEGDCFTESVAGDDSDYNASNSWSDAGAAADKRRVRRTGPSPEPVAPRRVTWPVRFTGSDQLRLHSLLSTPPPLPMPLAADFQGPAAASAAAVAASSATSGVGVASSDVNSNWEDGSSPGMFGWLFTLARAHANNSNRASGGEGSVDDNVGSAVASGRTLTEIETAMEQTRNNSNHQQRYEMRGGHAVEICSRVEYPNRQTRDVSVTVEATHSNGCHRVIMLKGLTAKKRPDLGPKVKDCRLRMDQIVMTRSSASENVWQKSITMSYDSDFQVGLREDRSRAQ